MREIKFRGKMPNGAWVYGSFWDHPVYPDIIDEYSNYRLVDRDTVGQFTGLKDFEGREIYEGDVVTLGNDPTPSAVRWDNELACYIIVEKLILGHVYKYVRVIGNVHDNPELLERKP